MKKLALLLLLLTGSAFAQPIVDSSQHKLKTGGGLAGDTANALAVSIYRASAAPSSPVTGQLWCDTTLTPCTLKQYTGTVWTAPQVNAAITTQADVSSFPGSPVDGQIFFSKSPYALYIYDATAAAWASLVAPLVTSNANIRDVYTATLVTSPGALTAATSATAGSLGAGTYSWKVTCRTATGGETTAGTVSNTITPGNLKSADLSSIPVCSGGTTTNRNIYRTTTGNAAIGPWLWVANIADNSTTTYHDGAADGRTKSPDINFSAPLPGTWAAILSQSPSTSGGCGGTGASRATMACWAGDQGAYQPSTSDPVARASLDISSYSSGNYTAQYRVKQVSGNGDTYLGVTAPGGWLSLRAGTADNAVRYTAYMGGSAGGNCNVGGTLVFPLSPSNRAYFVWQTRDTVGGSTASTTNCNFAANPYPQIDAVPFWVRVVRKNSYIQQYVSSDGIVWSPLGYCTSATNTTVGCSQDGANMGSSSLNRLEISGGYSTLYSNVQFGNGWVEIDNFSLTIN